jgi:hypothetical protein
MSPSRLLLICLLIPYTAAIARSDAARDLLTKVKTTISARLPLVAEGKLLTDYDGHKISRFIKCGRRAANGSETESWEYEGVAMGTVPPFFVALPNDFADPLDLESVADLSTGTEKPDTRLRPLGKEQIDGVNYDVVEVTRTTDQTVQTFSGPITVKSIVRKFYIGDDGLIHRIFGEVAWVEGDPAGNGKGAPVKTTQFTLNVTSYRKAMLFAPRPDTQPPTQTVVLKPDSNPGQPVFAVSQDGRLLAWGTQEGDIRLIDVGASHERGVLNGHLAPLTALAFSADGKRLASADALVLAVWNTETGKPLYTLHDQPDVHHIAFAPDGKSMVVAGSNRSAQLLDVATGRKLHTIDHRIENRFAFSPNGAYLANVTGFQVLLWDTATWQLTALDENNLPAFGQVAFSPDSKYVALGGHYGMVRVWNTRTGHKVQDLDGAPGPISAVWFSADGWRITALDADDRGDIFHNGPGLTTWSTLSWKMTDSLNLKSGKGVDMGGVFYTGNTFICRVGLGQLDESAHNVRFWPFPILPAKR